MSDDVSTELDTVIPRHQLLDNTAAKHKTDLIHRGTLATRHKPTGEGLKTQILRRQSFLLSKENSPAPDNDSKKLLNKPDRKAKDAKVSLLADLQKLHKKTVKEETPEPVVEVSKNIIKESDKVNNNVDEEDVNKKSVNPLLAEIENKKNSNTKSKGKVPPPPPPPKPASNDDDDEDNKKQVNPFLAEIENKKNSRLNDSKLKEQPPPPPSKPASNVDEEADSKKPVNPFLADIENAKNSKPKLKNSKSKSKDLPSKPAVPSIQDQLRLKLEARKKLVDDTDEGAETAE